MMGKSPESATISEEVKNPQKAIPTAIIASLSVIFLAYFGVSSVLTLMCPYYLQDADAPIPFAFSLIGWTFAQWVVGIGGIVGLCASMFGGMFPLPRIIYAMSHDGLLYKFLSDVHPKYKTPFIGTLLSGILTGVMAAGFKLKHLIDMMSMGTLVAYTIVAACIMLLRYRETNATSNFDEHSHLISDDRRPSYGAVVRQMVTIRSGDEPTALTSSVATVHTVIYCILSVILSICLARWESLLIARSTRHIIICSGLGVLMLLNLISISLQPSSVKSLSFKVPLVPFVPGASIFLNTYLMMLMDLQTWIRFLVWLLVGIFIYFTYGIRHSSENRRMSTIDYESNGQWMSD